MSGKAGYGGRRDGAGRPPGSGIDPALRCSFNGNGKQCGNAATPESPNKRCRFHGGLTAKIRKARLMAEVSKITGVFWDPETPPIADVGEALLQLAGRLSHTNERLSERLDQQLANFDEHAQRQAQTVTRLKDLLDLGLDHGGPDACPECGVSQHAVDRALANAEALLKANPLDEGAARMWQFVTKELVNILTKIEALGLVERQIRLQEGQALLMAGIFDRVFAAVALTDDQREAAKIAVLAEVRELEA